MIARVHLLEIVDISNAMIIELGSLLNTHPYTPDATEGFDVDFLSKSRIEATYIEKIQTDHIISDPLNQKLTYTTISFLKYRFSIGKAQSNLELWDHPRSSSPLFSCFNRILSTPMTVLNRNIELKHFWKWFKSEVPASKLSLVEFDTIVCGYQKNIEITVFGSDIETFASKYSKINSAKGIKKLGIEINLDGESLSVDITPDLRIKGESSAVELIKDKALKYLKTLKVNSSARTKP